MLAISALALAEVWPQEHHPRRLRLMDQKGAIGDLDTSTKHLKGFRTAMQLQKHRHSLPQAMLKM